MGPSALVESPTSEISADEALDSFKSPVPCPVVEPRTWPALPNSVVKSAGRTLQIFEYFDNTRRSARMVDIARELGYPESSTSILLRSLVTMGYIDFDRSDRTYRPTRRVRLLGNWVDTPLFENDRILRLMEDLSAETADTIILASRNGINVQYIHVVQAHTTLRLHLPPGTIRPLAASATGWVLLSALPDLEIAKLVRRINSVAPSLDQVVKVSDLFQTIASIRSEGHVMTRSSVTPGSSILAMPLPSGLTNSPLAIAIGGLSNRMEARSQELITLLNRRIKEGFPA